MVVLRTRLGEAHKVEKKKKVSIFFPEITQLWPRKCQTKRQCEMIANLHSSHCANMASQRHFPHCKSAFVNFFWFFSKYVSSGTSLPPEVSKFFRITRIIIRTGFWVGSHCTCKIRKKDVQVLHEKGLFLVTFLKKIKVWSKKNLMSEKKNFDFFLIFFRSTKKATIDVLTPWSRFFKPP